MADVVEVNCKTGEVVERAFTSAEKAQRDRDIAEAQQETARRAAETQRREAAKARIVNNPQYQDIATALGWDEA